MKIETTFENTLFEDSAHKEVWGSKLDIVFDDYRNAGIMEFNDLCDDSLEYGKTYKFTIKIEEIE